MNHLSSDILSMSREAGVLIEKNRISYANPAAERILGSDCRGKTMAAVFGEDVAGNQASDFIGNVSIKGTQYVLRVSRSGEAKIIFFSPLTTIITSIQTKTWEGKDNHSGDPVLKLLPLLKWDI